MRKRKTMLEIVGCRRCGKKLSTLKKPFINTARGKANFTRWRAICGDCLSGEEEEIMHRQQGLASLEYNIAHHARESK